MRRFVIGDIHGRHEALLQVLEACQFDFNEDRLIVLGDIVDGDVGVRDCFETLLNVKHLVIIMGNHDQWFLDWCKNPNEKINNLWYNQGGIHTMASYNFKRSNVPPTHIKLLENAFPYYLMDGMLFVHGGFNPYVPLHEQPESFLQWDRSIIEFAKEHIIPGFYHVFVGHTTTQIVDKTCTIPRTFHNLTMLDTGAGWNGKLTIMNINTNEYWQSKQQEPGPSKNKLRSLYFEYNKAPLTKSVVNT